MASTPQMEHGTGDQTPSTHHHPHHHHHHPHFPHGRRLLHFRHPHTGRWLHVCHTPEDLEKKRHELLRTETKEEDFDVILHGSPEHLDAIRDLQLHQEDQREKLREMHGEIYDQFESVKNELDLLNDELHRLTTHAVALDASFDKYGYSAHLRTKDDSETSSINDDHSAMEKHQNRATVALKFFKRPQIRQYFHKGLLWRSSQSGEVASFELFCDLLYVGVIDIIGELAVEEPSGLSLLHFVIAFSIGWKIWADLTNIANWFVIEDIFQRMLVVFYLICLFGFTTNISYMFTDEQSTYTSAIAFYITQRLYAGAWYILVAFLVPTIRGTMVMNALMILVTVALWIGSIHVDWPGQLALILTALSVDLWGALFIMMVVRRANQECAIGRLLKKHFEFYPAINIEHRVERNNAFVALVFGYSILTIIYQSHASFGINAFFGKAVLGLIQAFAFNWIYFDIDSAMIHVHAIRRHWVSSTIWVSAHLPFIMGYVLAAATLSQLVLAHDCSDADPEDLGELYIPRSVSEVDSALRWFYCGGLGIALISMGLISLTHVHKQLVKGRLRKRPRLAVRACVAITIICLPLADSLSSLDLISITTALVVFVLCLDIFGNSSEGDKFWSGGLCHVQRKKCTYTAQCRVNKQRRKELQKAVERGEKVGLADLLKHRGSTSSIDTQQTLKDEEWHGGHY